MNNIWGKRGTHTASSKGDDRFMIETCMNHAITYNTSLTQWPLEFQFYQIST